VLAAAVAADIGDATAYRTKQAFQTNARLDKAAAAAVESPGVFYRSEFRRQFQGVAA
jgi:hypothetical protein